MKIKLPRKRKKAYIKKYSRVDYVAMTIIAEILYEEKPIKKNTRYPEFKIGRYYKLIVLFNW